MATIGNVIEYFETRYPSSIRDLTYDKDNTGLLYGEKTTPLTSLVLTLECSLEAIAYAIDKQANLIVCHHTPFFKPIHVYAENDYRVQVLKLLMQHNIAVYCSHTALDRAKPEYNISGLLAQHLGLSHVRALETDDQGYGLGVCVDVNMPSDTFLSLLEDKFGPIRTNQVNQDQIHTIGIIGGAGEYYWKMAKNLQCDAFLTGDVTFHPAQDAHRENFLLIDIGHQAEQFALFQLQDWLNSEFPVFFFEQKKQILQ